MKMHTKRANMPRLCGVDDALQEGILTNEGSQSSGWFSVFSSFGTELKTTIQVSNSNYHDRGSEIIELSPDYLLAGLFSSKQISDALNRFD